MRTRRLFAAAGCIAITVGLFGAGSPVSAQTTTGGFGAAPAHSDPADPATRAYFKPVLAPGAVFTDEVVVTNSGESAVPLLVSAVDGLTGQTSGAVYANRDAPRKKTGTWVSPSITALTLAPHAQQLVPFTVRVPAGTTPGDHLAGIAVEDANPKPSGGQFSVTEVFRTVVGIDITVPGPAEPGLHLGNLALKALPGTSVVTLSTQLGDPGRKLVKPAVSVSLRGPAGYRNTVNRRLDTILPGDTIAYPFIWPDSLLKGTYHVTVRATGGPQPIVRHTTLRLGTTLRGATHSNLPPSGHFAILEIALATALVMILLTGLIVWRRRCARREAARRAELRVRRYHAARRSSPAEPSEAMHEPTATGNGDGAASRDVKPSRR